MKKEAGVRRVDGHRYYLFLDRLTKALARERAHRLRLQGYGARVYKTSSNGWAVYSTDMRLC